MDNSEHNNGMKAAGIFAGSTCLSSETLYKYVRDELLPEEKLRAEKHILDCELCTDAVEGFTTSSDTKSTIKTSQALQEDISKLTTEQNRSLVPMNITQSIAVAAGILLLVGASIYLISQFGGSSETMIAEEIVTEEIESKPAGQSNILQHADLKAASDSVKAFSFPPSMEDKNTSLGNQEDRLVEDRTKLRETDRAKEAKQKKRIILEDEFFNIKQVRAKDMDEEALMDAPLNAPAPESLRMSSSVTELSPYEKAMESFSDGNYQIAARGFKKVLETDPDNYAALYHGGVSYLYTSRSSKALVNFDKIIKNRSNSYYEDARWQKARVLAKKGRTDEAKKLLNAIIYSDGKYRQQAQQALEDL